MTSCHTHTIIKKASAAAAAATYQTFTGENFKQLDEHLAISQVDVQVLDAAADAHQMRVDPLSERLLLHAFSLIFTQTYTYTDKYTHDYRQHMVPPTQY